MARALKFSITTSASRTRSRNAARPASCLRSTATLFLLRCNFTKMALTFHGSCSGGSPPSQPPSGRPPRNSRGPRPIGASIFTTSAPRSARVRVASGPAQTWVRSRMRSSRSGPSAIARPAGRVRVCFGNSVHGADSTRLRKPVPVEESTSASFGVGRGAPWMRQEGRGERSLPCDVSTCCQTSRTAKCGSASTSSKDCTTPSGIRHSSARCPISAFSRSASASPTIACSASRLRMRDSLVAKRSSTSSSGMSRKTVNGSQNPGTMLM